MELNAQAARIRKQYEAAYPFILDMQAVLMDACALLDTCFSAGGKLLICGNGGSNADAEHIVGELGKSFLCERPIAEALRERLMAAGQSGAFLADSLQAPLPAINLGTHTSLGSAVANDVDAALCFAQPLLAYGRPGDVLLAISTSGNSNNVILAATLARAMGIRVIGLTGQGGGQLGALCDVLLRVPEQDVFFIQEKHVAVYHLLCALLEAQRWADCEADPR